MSKCTMCDFETRSTAEIVRHQRTHKAPNIDTSELDKILNDVRNERRMILRDDPMGAWWVKEDGKRKLERGYAAEDSFWAISTDEINELKALIHRVEVASEIKGKLLAMDKMIMGAGEYHDDPYEYVVPIRHIKEYRAELSQFDLTQPIFRDKATLQDTAKGDSK